MKIPRFEAPTEWLKPTEFPDLRHVDEIAIDLETKDPNPNPNTSPNADPGAATRRPVG